MKKLAIAILLAVSTLASSFLPVGNAMAASVLTQGSANGNVWDLQYRLYAAGFYLHPLDGIYGAETRLAVAHFQHNYGLTPDGVVGSATWKALHKYSLDQSEMDLLAHLIYAEARGEPYTGQVAVGAVVMNRIKSPLFADNIRGVIFQQGAFSSVSDGQFWLKPNATAYRAALDAVRGWDPSHHALYFFNPNTSTSSWIWSRPQLEKIGNHIFAK